MAAVSVTLTFDSTQAQDILAALEKAQNGFLMPEWVSLLPAPATYAALTDLQKGKAQLLAFATILTRVYRRQVAVAALANNDPAIT